MQSPIRTTPPWWFSNSLGVEEVDFLGVEHVAVLGQLQQGAAGLVTGRDKHVIVADDRRGNVGHAVGDLVVAPQELAGVGRHADRPAADDRHVLAHTIDLRGHDRRSSRPRPCRDRRSPASAHFQIRSPVFLFERHHRGVFDAGRADDLVAVDQRRFTPPPDRTSSGRRNPVSRFFFHFNSPVLASRQTRSLLVPSA